MRPCMRARCPSPSGDSLTLHCSAGASSTLSQCSNLADLPCEPRLVSDAGRRNLKFRAATARRTATPRRRLIGSLSIVQFGSVTKPQVSAIYMVRTCMGGKAAAPRRVGAARRHDERRRGPACRRADRRSLLASFTVLFTSLHVASGWDRTLDGWLLEAAAAARRWAGGSAASAACRQPAFLQCMAAAIVPKHIAWHRRTFLAPIAAQGRSMQSAH